MTTDLFKFPDREERAKAREVKKYPVPPGDVGRPCEACGRQLHFVRTEAGKIMPVEWDGTPHWGRCTDPMRFSNRRRKMDDDAAEERKGAKA